MSIPGKAASGFVLGLLLLGTSAPSAADPHEGEDDRQGSKKGRWVYDEGLKYETEDGKFLLEIQNRMQLRFTGADPDLGDTKGSFDVSRYKLVFAGKVFGDWAYRLQMDLAAGSEDSSDLLEDAFLVYIKHNMAELWAGQGRVPFGRQELIYSDSLQFIERSIATQRFAPGRDVGFSVRGQNKKKTYEYQFGVYNGSGINKDEGDNIDFMGVARLVFTPFGEYKREETDLDRPKSSKLAIGVAAMTNTVGTEGFEEQRVERGDLELAYKTRGFNFVAEFFTESADDLLGVPPTDEIDTDGWYAQAGWLFPNQFEVVGRYSEILPDVPGRDETEAGMAFNYYFARHDHKIQLDYRVLEFELSPSDPGFDDQFIDREVLRVQLQIVF